MAGTSGSISAAGTDAEYEILCDDNAGVITPFMRRLVDTNGVVSVVDTALDGTTVYAPTGTVGRCPLETTDSEALVLCDDDGAGNVVTFLRTYTFAADGTVTTEDLDLAGAAYTVVGTVGVCAAAAGDEHEFEVLCDVNAGVATTFLRRYSVDEAGVVTVTNTTLDGVTAYAPTGTVGICSAATVNPQIDSTIQRQVGAGTVTIPAGARSVTVTVVSGAPTVAIGGGAATTLPAGGSFSWGIDRGGDPGEALQDEFVFTGVAGSDFVVHTTREV
ncbi:hypothetical protein [Nonomuraea recticatena]|uniref:Uncharacterized protein n=1 Tax=Nonomuraea recticatena TaxID=46178 RepID=A0ABN3TBB5_9ACTN